MPASPFPERANGVAVRYSPVVNHLSRYCDVELVQLATPWAPAMESGSDCGALNAFSVIEVPPVTSSLLRRALIRLGSIAWPRPPYPLRRHVERQVIAALERSLAGRHFDVGIWVTTGFAHHGLRVMRTCCDRVVYDAIDSCFSAMSKEPRNGILGRWDAFWVKRWEQGLSRRADAAIYISRGDIELLGRGSPDFKEEVLHLPNGVLVDDFTSRRAQIEGVDDGDFVIGFLGNMAYTPNIRAAQRLARIFATVRDRVSDAKLVIIGRAPTPAIRALSRDEDTVVTGRVENIWEYVNRVNVFVFPMETGAGQQNKVLEAMFASRPVVGTPIANLGVGARPGEEILVGTTDEEIAEHIIRLSTDRSLVEQLGRRGHEFVMRNYSWEAILPRFEEAIFGVAQ